MSLLAPFSGVWVQPSGGFPSAFVASGLLGEIGATRVDPFLHWQSRVLERITRRDETVGPASGPSHVIYGSAEELLAVARERGLNDPPSLACTGILCETVFAQGAPGWPEPIREIGRVISGRNGQWGPPWAIAALPLGRELFLHGKTLEGMTSSSRFNERVLLTAAWNSDLVIDGRPPLPNVTTYLGGNLWRDRQGLLPKVALYEASHYVHLRALEDWMEGNAARPAEVRDAAFTRHCVRESDGSYRVELGFATLFLELAACAATRVFFQAILSTVDAEKSFLPDLIEESLIRGIHLMTDPQYQPYLEMADIAPPTRDIRSVTSATQRFVALVK